MNRESLLKLENLMSAVRTYLKVEDVFYIEQVVEFLLHEPYLQWVLSNPRIVKMVGDNFAPEYFFTNQQILDAAKRIESPDCFVRPIASTDRELSFLHDDKKLKFKRWFESTRD
jgi:hypothetical protein